ncbi:MAG: SprT protein, partial [Nonlabens sp.]
FRKRTFRKLQEKRTRAVCLELNTQRRYLIPMMAEVKLID